MSKGTCFAGWGPSGTVGPWNSSHLMSLAKIELPTTVPGGSNVVPSLKRQTTMLHHSTIWLSGQLPENEVEVFRILT